VNYMSTKEEKLLEVIKELKRDQERILQELEELKQRISEVERIRIPTSGKEQLPPALLKTLKILLEEGEVGATKIHEELKVSRSLAYNYLNELVRMGLLEKRPYLGKGKQRYLYVLKKENIPEEILKIIERAT